MAAVLGGCLLLAAGAVAAAVIVRSGDGAGGRQYQPIVVPGTVPGPDGADVARTAPAPPDPPGPADLPGPSVPTLPSAPTLSTPAGPAALLTEEQAKQVALARAPGATSIRIHLEYDDGYHVYEGEIIHGDWEYDFEIDAYTGEILEWDADSHHD